VQDSSNIFLTKLVMQMCMNRFSFLRNEENLIRTCPQTQTKFSQISQTLLDKVNEDIYRPLGYARVFIASKFSRISAF
jgi:hypothetical protein